MTGQLSELVSFCAGAWSAHAGVPLDARQRGLLEEWMMLAVEKANDEGFPPMPRKIDRRDRAEGLMADLAGF